MSQSWEEFVAGLSQGQRDHMLHELLKWQLEELSGDGDVKFTYWGDRDPATDIFWASCGKSLVREPDGQAVPVDSTTGLPAAMPLTAGALRRHIDSCCVASDTVEFMARNYNDDGSRIRLLFESADSRTCSQKLLINLRQAAPAFGDPPAWLPLLSPSPARVAAILASNVRVMLNDEIGLLCREAQLTSHTDNPKHPTLVILFGVVGPTAIVAQLIADLKLPNGRPELLLVDREGKHYVLRDVKVVDIGWSFVSLDMQQTEHIVIYSTTKLDLP